MIFMSLLKVVMLMFNVLYVLYVKTDRKRDRAKESQCKKRPSMMMMSGKSYYHVFGHCLDIDEILIKNSVATPPKLLQPSRVAVEVIVVTIPVESIKGNPILPKKIHDKRMQAGNIIIFEKSMLFHIFSSLSLPLSILCMYSVCVCIYFFYRKT